MTWTADEFRSRHNKSLDTDLAGEAAEIANDVLARTGDEVMAVKVANAKIARKAKGRRPKAPRFMSTGKEAY